MNESIQYVVASFVTFNLCLRDCSTGILGDSIVGEKDGSMVHASPHFVFFLQCRRN